MSGALGLSGMRTGFAMLLGRLQYKDERLKAALLSCVSHHGSSVGVTAAAGWTRLRREEVGSRQGSPTAEAAGAAHLGAAAGRRERQEGADDCGVVIEAVENWCRRPSPDREEVGNQETTKWYYKNDDGENGDDFHDF